MPTLRNVEGYRFFFFSNERGEPPHVHVEGRDAGYAKFWLNPVRLAESKRFKPPELRRAEELVLQYADDFRSKWNAYFSR